VDQGDANLTSRVLGQLGQHRVLIHDQFCHTSRGESLNVFSAVKGLHPSASSGIYRERPLKLLTA
jgi:hypothetical protein